MTGLKYEKNERSKVAIRDRMKEYMVFVTSLNYDHSDFCLLTAQTRAEQINELIKQKNEPAPAAVAVKKVAASSHSLQLLVFRLKSPTHSLFLLFISSLALNLLAGVCLPNSRKRPILPLAICCAQINVADTFLRSSPVVFRTSF